MKNMQPMKAFMALHVFMVSPMNAAGSVQRLTLRGTMKHMKFMVRS